jgi:DNA-binding NarL/FixJ family response regulator
MKVLLIGSTPMIRHELRTLFEDQADIRILEEAENPVNTDGSQQVENLSPDVVVLDFQKSFQKGTETVNRMLASKPKLKIIALSMQSDRRYLNECLKAGVCGYVLKDCACEELVDAIRAVAADRKYLSRDLR